MFTGARVDRFDVIILYLIYPNIIFSSIGPLCLY